MSRKKVLCSYQCRQYEPSHASGRTATSEKYPQYTVASGRPSAGQALKTSSHSAPKAVHPISTFRLGLLLVGMALMGSAFPATVSASETDNGPAITVLVFNFRQVPAGTLLKAEKEAGRVFEQAGVSVTWRDCPTGNEPCRKAPGRVFFLAMMVGPVQSKFLDTISGYALLPDHIAAVYYDYLPALPDDKSNKNDTALVLGCVIAHELGHLLLGARGHSIGGIMQAQWGIEQTQRSLMSELSFLTEEGILMKANTLAPEAKKISSSALKSH